MTVGRRLPSRRDTAEAFLRAVRTRFNMDPKVSWATDRSLLDGPIPIDVDALWPDTVTLKWDWFVHLAGAAMAEQDRR